MWNPPWTLSLILPFGLVDYTTGQFFWLLAQVSCVLAAARISWSISGRGTRGNWIPWLLGLTFIPTGLVLILGQITPLILFALSALLYFERKESWFALGASITVLSIKPHLIYLFWVVLVLWIWQRKRWRVVLGAVASGVCIALIPLLLDPQVYSEYFALYQYQGITKPMEWSAPTLGNVFKILFHFESNGPQAIFSMFAVAWVLGYWRRYKDSWLWSEHLPLLILVSVTTNFFVWTYDQVVFVLAIIQRATWLEGRRWGWYDCIGVTSYVLINLIYLIGKCFVINDAPYFWLAPAFMTSYLLLKHGANLSKTI